MEFAECACSTAEEDWHKARQVDLRQVTAVIYECETCGTQAYETVERQAV